MPIKVSCACGAAFNAKDELAGKTVKCPKCTQPLRIPTPGGQVVSPQAAPQAGPVQRSAPAPASNIPSIFDEAGIEAAPQGVPICPSCHKPIRPGTILCVNCGFNMQTGRKLQTQSFTVKEGHGVSVEVALAKAADRIADEINEERKKTSEGLPWFVYLVMFLAMVGLMAALLLMPPENSIMLIGMVIVGIAGLVNLYAGISILIVAFKDSVAQGIMCIVIPLYGLIYIIMHWSECGTYFLIQIGSNIVAGGGWGIVIYGASRIGEEKETTKYIPGFEMRPRVAIVRMVDDSYLNSPSIV